MLRLRLISYRYSSTIRHLGEKKANKRREVRKKSAKLKDHQRIKNDSIKNAELKEKERQQYQKNK